MSLSNIEWTQQTWNPTTGCDKITAGCRDCYAIRMAWRLMHSPHKAIADKYAGTVYKTDDGNLNWTGKINTLFTELTKPLLNKTPTTYFVNSMSDLFHEKIEVSFIAEVFAIMWLTPQHTYQVLTKRAERMKEVLNSEMFFVYLFHAVQERVANELEYEDVFKKMPLKNVWLGVSTENQEQADNRIPFLLDTPAAIRFLSCEPLLGPVTLPMEYLSKWAEIDGQPYHKINWVIAGGESGPKARPMHPDWARSLRDQCKEANIPFFFKQWGEYYTKWVNMTTGEPVFKMYDSYLQFTQKLWVYKGDACVDMKGKHCKIGGDFMDAAYPVAIMNKVGKHAAGNLLDGVKHQAYPSSLLREEAAVQECDATTAK